LAKVAIVSPARNEKYLIPTVEDALTNARGEVEFIAVLEGYTPDGWAELQARTSNLHTIYHSEPQGMRKSINDGVASAISRGAKYILKVDAHCSFAEGFDEVLKADCDKDWVVIPRRLRLDVENWQVREDGRPPIDYHYLSFPDNLNDFGGPGLNGKVWAERARERYGKPEYDIDSEMASQGSFYFLHADYFQYLELMDEEHYGKFWNESQEVLNKCWLSGGRGVINKKTWISHWHKGSAGRGYHLPKDWLNQGASFSKRWMFNDAAFNHKQTRPFSWLIKHFWPVPTWPENWEELVYGAQGSAMVVNTISSDGDRVGTVDSAAQLTIHSARYGIGGPDDLDVTQLLQAKVANNSLDLNVTNSDLEVGNPFRGQKKQLVVTYSYDGQPPTTITKDERDWLIIGQSARYVRQPEPPAQPNVAATAPVVEAEGPSTAQGAPAAVATLSPVALTDYLVRKFQIPAHRLRGPMPIEVPSFHRNDLALLFAELGFQHGAEIGVAEGNYSEVLLKANPELHLLLVDPWHAYSGNPQNKSKEKNEYAFNECKRKVTDYPNAKMDMRLSMDAVRDVPDGSLDMVYIDGHHSYSFVMQDLIAWSKKVRSGGIVSGDDVYRLNVKWGAGPMEAVYDYTQAMKIEPWFLINAHKSVDFSSNNRSCK
jgi:hypothetical protein